MDCVSGAIPDRHWGHRENTTETVWWIVASKPDALSLVLKTHGRRGEPTPQICPLTSTHVTWRAHTHTHTYMSHMYKHTYMHILIIN